MVDERKAPDGYKVTEVGVIPEDWDIYPFGDYLDIFSGKGFSKSEYSSTGTKLIRIDNVSYGKITWDTVAYLPNYYKEIYSSLCLYEGDLLLALNRPITNGRLKLARLGAADVPSILYQRVGKIVLNSQTVNHDFAFYILNKFITEFVEKTSVGSDQPFISTTNLKKMKIVSPPLPEQKAIAEALSETDDLIQSVEKLIDKKKKIKQGAMQQLLNGKKRLSGFSGSTTLVTLDDILSLNKGEQLNRSGLSSKGDYPVINGGVEPSGYTDGWNTLENTITISEGGNSCGYVNYLETKFWSGGHAYTVKLKSNEIDQHYLYQLLKINESKIMALRVGSGLPNIQKKSLYEYKVRLVVDLVEQKAIAQVLSDMDTEIEALEEKLEKVKTIKQGMMQELLTGRIRLI